MHPLSCNFVERAIASSTNLSLLLRAVGEIDSAPEASHRISHIVTSAPYLETSIVFGSDYIKARVTEILLSRQREELFAFVSRETNPLFAQMRGDCFEALAHERLEAGGDFRTRLLTPPFGEEVCSLAKTTLRCFSGSNPADLVSIRGFCAGDYCRPIISNFPVVDAFILPRSRGQTAYRARREAAARVGRRQRPPPGGVLAGAVRLAQGNRRDARQRPGRLQGEQADRVRDPGGGRARG